MKQGSLIRWVGLLALPLTLGLAAACSDDDGGDDGGSGSGNTSGSGGSGGSGGSAGSSGGSAGSAGSSAGSAGSAGGTAGAGGAAGSSGGSGGSAGSAGGGGGEKVSLFFTGTGFDPHDAQLFRIVVLEKDTQTPVANVSITGVQNGFIALSFPKALEVGKTYNVNYYADLNKNGTCDPQPNDHVWSKEVVADKDVDLQVTHDTNWTDVCSSFAKVPDGQNLTVTGTGFDPHNGQSMAFALVGKANDNVLAGAVIDKVVNGAFGFTWHGALKVGNEYTFNYFADLNNSGACDPQPTDHVWSQPISAVTAPVTLDLKHDTNWTDVCKYF